MWTNLIIAVLNAQAHLTILTAILEKALHEEGDRINGKRHDCVYQHHITAFYICQHRIIFFKKKKHFLFKRFACLQESCVI